MPEPVTITIDRQDRRNALDVGACTQLTTQLEAAAQSGARAVVLTGAGPHFCAGADLDLVRGTALSTALSHLLGVISTLPVPVIAAVRGAALGAGTQLAMACDLRVVDPTARFGIPAAKLGLMVDHWTVQRLALLAGHSSARAMLLAAEELDAAAALRLGFAHREGDLRVAEAWAKELAELAPLSLAGHKVLLHRLERDGSADAGSAEAYGRAWASADALEGITSFQERRRPRFEGT